MCTCREPGPAQLIPIRFEKSVAQFSAEELAELEQIIRKARRAKEQAQKPSLREMDGTP
jgi:hypothetical protein